MSIRYKCEECGTVLKIKDSLAGTRGRCPHCRHKFIVPQQSTAADDDFGDQSNGNGAGAVLELNTESPSSKSLEPVRPPEPVSPPPVAAPAPVAETPPAPPVEEEFDAADFLMADAGPNAKKSAGLSAPSPDPAAAGKPATDSQGRRYFSRAPIIPNAPPGAPAAAAAVAPGATPPPVEEVGSSVTTKVTLPTEEPRRKLNFKGSGRALVRMAPGLLVIAILSGGVYWIARQYLMPHLPLPELAPVAGKVHLDGKPFPNVVVHLTPVNAAQGKSRSDKAIRLTDSLGVTDNDGLFHITYFGHGGAPLGKARIWLEPLEPSGYKKIPHRYQQAGADIRDVREAGNDGKFDLELKLE
ncbi:hypothetical protein [Planctomicrobium piriforme]|uniref:Uncharacterized protein n=1 Tax=Planctomicrobium piriforme TaxID=1576369 RepID=A0A1I3M3Y3_9PLAN|nr:hypothetical protein [Planctomicrobium piriforme]SFI91678.1 hypothetical protein SAMN05421753_113150 [Planctomicrobium piriforme]